MGSGSHSTSTLSNGSRAARPGSQVVRAAVAGVLLAVIAIVAVVAMTGSGVRSGPSRSTRAARPTSIPAGAYGYIPSWLPQSKVQVERVVTATPAHPQLTIQGDTVKVDLGHVHVLATASGPTVPQIGHFPLPRTTPCAFSITFADASGAVPLERVDFATIDEVGRLHTLRVTRVGGGSVPSEVLPGQAVTLRLSAVLPTGEGRFMWAPLPGRPIVQWDFDVEID